jgi:hypothetical protein
LVTAFAEGRDESWALKEANGRLAAQLKAAREQLANPTRSGAAGPPTGKKPVLDKATQEFIEQPGPPKAGERQGPTTFMEAVKAYQSEFKVSEGEAVRQWGEDDRFTGSLELEDQPATAASETKYVTLSMSPWPYDTRLKEGSVYYHTLTDHEVFGELYTDRKYERFFLFPYQQTSDGESAKHIHFPNSPVYVAPASSADEALTLMEPYKEGLWQ